MCGVSVCLDLMAPCISIVNSGSIVQLGLLPFSLYEFAQPFEIPQRRRKIRCLSLLLLRKLETNRFGFLFAKYTELMRPLLLQCAFLLQPLAFLALPTGDHLVKVWRPVEFIICLEFINFSGAEFICSMN